MHSENAYGAFVAEALFNGLGKAVCYKLLHCVAMGCGLLQRVAVCCCLLRFVAKALFNGLRKAVCYNVL